MEAYDKTFIYVHCTINQLQLVEFLRIKLAFCLSVRKSLFKFNGLWDQFDF